MSDTLKQHMASREQALLQAEQLILKGALKQAAQLLTELGQQQPSDPRIYLLGSMMAEAAGNIEGAEQSARQAVELAPKWSVALIRLAEMTLRQGKSQDGLRWAQSAVAHGPGLPQWPDGDLLVRAANVALKAGRGDVALPWLEGVARLRPEDDDVRLTIGDLLLQAQQYEAAASSYAEVLGRGQQERRALVGRLRTRMAQGAIGAMREDAAKLVDIEPDGELSHFFWQLAQGETPASQPRDMVAGLFDSYAAFFDDHLVRGMRYQLPKRVADLIREWNPSLRLNVLDLGCGSGLLGVCLGRIDGALIGVDLSAGMIEQAKMHQVYDRFHLVDIAEALTQTPAGLYQVIAALDVVGYVGRLDDILQQAHRVLADGGRLIFSFEETGEDVEAPFVFDPLTSRYSHGRAAVSKFLKLAGFHQVDMSDMVLRVEEARSVPGVLVVAHKVG